MRIKKVSFIILLSIVFCLHADSERFDGVFTVPEKDRFFLLGQFIKYDPKILSIGCGPLAKAKCDHWWPKGTFFAEIAEEPPDIIWIESDGDELGRLQDLGSSVLGASVIYTSTHFDNRKSPYPDLRFFLELSGFTLISHWYREEGGHAIFLKKDIFDAAMRTLNYWPNPSSFGDYPDFYLLQPLFKRLEGKAQGHCIENIDFIYMINLDERPEKFALASGGLELYGISPYRFSAVNGWKLSIEEIEQIGLKVAPGMLKETFLGSIYREIDGVKYRSNEKIREGKQAYFSIGMSLGSIGIVLSHLSVLSDAYQSGYETIWVMEDDVEAVEDPQQMVELIAELDVLAPDWDILFTDTDTKDTQGQHVPCRAMACRPNFCVQTLDSFWPRFHPVGERLSRMGMRYGAYSMIVRRSGMKKILQYFQSYGVFLPYDMDFWLIPDLKMYSPNRDIVTHAVRALTDNNLPHYQSKEQPNHHQIHD